MKFDFKAELGKVTPKIAEGASVYIFGTGGYFNYVYKLYKYLVDIDISEHIDGFIDNDVNKQGTQYYGRPVYSPDDIDAENSVVIISVLSAKMRNEILWQMAERGMHTSHSIFDEGCFSILIMRWEYNRLLQFKNKHKGERCFVLGNGSSLTAKDLDKIQDEFSFAANKIFFMFNQTQWRPTYYVVEAPEVISEYHNQIKEIDCTRFYGFNQVFDNDEFSLTGDYFFYSNYEYSLWPPEFRKLGFSEDPFILQWGGTVSYYMLQLAVYMGFNEIYVLGVDNNYSTVVNDKGILLSSDTANHFSPKYGKYVINANIDLSNHAYKTAREYCESHNIKIRNATRGGNLEVFERVDFDSLF